MRVSVRGGAHRSTLRLRPAARNYAETRDGACAPRRLFSSSFCQQSGPPAALCAALWAGGTTAGGTMCCSSGSPLPENFPCVFRCAGARTAARSGFVPLRGTTPRRGMARALPGDCLVHLSASRVARLQRYAQHCGQAELQRAEQCAVAPAVRCRRIFRACFGARGRAPQHARARALPGDCLVHHSVSRVARLQRRAQ